MRIIKKQIGIFYLNVVIVPIMWKRFHIYFKINTLSHIFSSGLLFLGLQFQFHINKKLKEWKIPK